jgi:DNA-binding response OmpR family regulator
MVCIAITASGLLRQADYYLQAGFDDFLAKPFLFDKVCERIKRHLAVEFTEPEPAAATDEKTEDFKASQCRIPADLQQRLLRAAETNALTEIEAGIVELRQLDAASGLLAERIASLVANYDMEGIEAEVRKTPVIDD